MPPFDGGGVLLRVWCVGVGGSALGLGCILLEKYTHRHYGQILTAAIGLLLCICGAVLGVTGHPVRDWAPVAALGAASLVAWAAHFAAYLRFTRRLTRPRAIWGLLLIVSPLYAMYAVSGLDNSEFDEKWDDSFIVSRDNVPDLRLVTDRGREVKVYRFVLSEEAEHAEQDWVAEGRLECHVIRTATIDPASNCHGWVFTGGRYAIHPHDVEAILCDNGYQRADTPLKGDLIVYRNDPGMILHSGIVLEVVHENLVLIESKWGPLGRYLHPPEYQPYGSIFAYYRSPRQGHQLPVVNVAERSSGATTAD